MFRRNSLYPFYLDGDMSMAFAAALTGGVALEEEQVDPMPEGDELDIPAPAYFLLCQRKTAVPKITSRHGALSIGRVSSPLMHGLVPAPLADSGW